MPKNTRNSKEYEVYSLRRLFKTQGSPTSPLVESMQELAIFDDNALAKAYMAQCKANPSKEAKVKAERFEIQSRWIGIEPAQAGFSLPFNPVYKENSGEAKVAKKSKKSK